MRIFSVGRRLGNIYLPPYKAPVANQSSVPPKFTLGNPSVHLAFRTYRWGVTGRSMGDLRAAAPKEGLHQHEDDPVAAQMSPSPSPLALQPSPRPQGHRQLKQNCCNWLGGVTGHGVEGPMTPPGPSQEGRSAVGNPSCDDLLRTGIDQLIKMVAMWFGGRIQNTSFCAVFELKTTRIPTKRMEG